MHPLSTSFEPALAISSTHSIDDNKKTTEALNPRSARSISFDDDCLVRYRTTIHVNDFSEDEIDACWFSNEQYVEMREEIRYVADLIDQGLLASDNATYCLRGAESKAPLQSRRRRKIRLAVRAEVLKEQALQRTEGCSDPDFISQVSQMESYRSIAYARQMALDDELAARLS